MKVLLLALLLTLTLSFAFSAPNRPTNPKKRSSHSEAPGTAAIPNADITDLYAFRSYESGRSAYVTFLLNAYPLQSPYGGPNYYSLSTEHFYELYIDSNNDGIEDSTFQWIYGNSLPMSGRQGLPYLFGQDYQCQPSYSFNNTPSQPANNISIGFALQIGGNSVAVALKVIGPVLGTGGSLSNINWQEYYSLNYLSGPLSNASSTTIQSITADTTFEKPFDYAGESSFGTASQYEAYALGTSFLNDISLDGIANCGTSDTGRVWVGQRSDPFWISLGRIFDFLNLIPVINPAFSTLTIAQCPSNNDLREKNVDVFALEIPIDCVNQTGILYIWAGTRNLYHNNDDLVGSTHIAGPQVSRMGNALVNELVIGLIDKDRFSRQHPAFDADPVYGFGTYVFYPTFPEIISIRYLDAVNGVLGTNFASLAPSTPRNDLVATYLTGISGLNQAPCASCAAGVFIGEVMRLNVNIQPVAWGSQNNLGVVGTVTKTGSSTTSDLAGFPNGRRPGDDVVDISLDVMTGILCSSPFASFALCANGSSFPIGGVLLTDGSPVQDTNFGSTFPYVNTPTPGSYVDNLINIVQNSSLCYPPGQHGRCPRCDDTSSGGRIDYSPSVSRAPVACPSGAGRIGGMMMSLLNLF